MTKRWSPRLDLVWWCVEEGVGYLDIPEGACGNGLEWMVDGRTHLRCGWRQFDNHDSDTTFEDIVAKLKDRGTEEVRVHSGYLERLNEALDERDMAKRALLLTPLVRLLAEGRKPDRIAAAQVLADNDGIEILPWHEELANAVLDAALGGSVILLEAVADARRTEEER